MRDLSLFLLKNSLSCKMRRGIRSFCHGVSSTSTLQQHHDGSYGPFLAAAPPSVVGSCVAESDVSVTEGAGGALTLEQMILQLDLEEAAARKAQHSRGDAAAADGPYRRRSCVNSSDRVLRSARDALSQYPRFSLDGRDAMYRASFSAPSRRSACCAGGGGGGEGYEMDVERTLRMPATVAGESVVWCKPGVVAKLMGLEAVPVPVGGGRCSGRRKAGGAPAMASRRKQKLRRAELEKERLFMALHGYEGLRSCHAGGQMNRGPIVRGTIGDADGWVFRHPR